MCRWLVQFYLILFKDEYKFNFKEEENKLYFQINIKLILKCNCIGYIITKEKWKSIWNYNSKTKNSNYHTKSCDYQPFGSSKDQCLIINYLILTLLYWPYHKNSKDYSYKETKQKIKEPLSLCGDSIKNFF